MQHIIGCVLLLSILFLTTTTTQGRGIIGSCSPSDIYTSFCVEHSSSTSTSKESAVPSPWIVLAKERVGLEHALSLLRVEFGKLEQQHQQHDDTTATVTVNPEDPLFGSLSVAPHDLEMTLLRYLQVARSSLSKHSKEDEPKIAEVALARIQATLHFRQDYDVLAMHAPGMARKIMYHDTNPGACLYAADAGLTDKQGRPALIGRLGLIIDDHAQTQHEPLVPANHLRAILFAFERLAVSLRLSEGKDRASYILDCSMDKTTAPDLYTDVDPRPRNWSRFGSLSVDGLSMSGWIDPNNQKKGKKKTNQHARTIPGVLPHLDSHQTITPGLPVLREALRQLTEYYPNVMERVYFVRAPFSFRAFMKVMKLMIDKESAEKFVVVPWGSEAKVLLDVFDEKQLPLEFGGTGPSLGRDDFLRVAADRYDNNDEEQQQFSRLRRSSSVDDDDRTSGGDTTPLLKQAITRSKYNDELAGVSATKEEAISRHKGSDVINGAGVRFYVSEDHDEMLLGTFNEQTELVVTLSTTQDAAASKQRRKKLMWPVAGWVEIPQEEGKVD